MGSFTHEIAKQVAALHAQLEREPRDLAAWDELARAWLRLGYCDKASSCIDRRSAFEPEAPRTLIARASLLEAQGRSAEGVPWAERAVAAGPGSVEPRFPARFQRRASAIERGIAECLRACLVRSPTRAQHESDLRHRGRFEDVLDIEQSEMDQAVASGERSRFEVCLEHLALDLEPKTVNELAELERRLLEHPEHFVAAHPAPRNTRL